MKRKYIVLGSLFLILVILLGVGVSYSLWNISNTQDKINTVMTSCFDITYSSDNDNISLKNSYPISDEKGLSLNPYTFTITNNCDINAYYKINLETLSSSNIDNKFMKVSLNGNNPKKISEYEKSNVSISNGKSSNALLTGYLPVGGSESFDLRVWMDYDTTIEDINNDGTDKWVGKVVVVSSPVNEDEITKVCQDKGGDLVDSGECRKYYVKVNNFSNPRNSSYSELIKNSDGSYTASTQGLTYESGSLQIKISPSSGLLNNHSIYYFINILNIGKKLNESSDKLLEFTKNTTIDGVSYWPRVYIIYSLDEPTVFQGIFTTSVSGWNSFYIESYAWAEFAFKNANLIDLTLMFGEGNEPDKEWCDKYLTEYYEYNTEGTLVPIKDIGEPVKTSYYDKIDMKNYN